MCAETDMSVASFIILKSFAISCAKKLECLCSTEFKFHSATRSSYQNVTNYGRSKVIFVLVEELEFWNSTFLLRFELHWNLARVQNIRIFHWCSIRLVETGMSLGTRLICWVTRQQNFKKGIIESVGKALLVVENMSKASIQKRYLLWFTNSLIVSKLLQKKENTFLKSDQ